MAGTINDFKSSFREEIARPSRFDVTIPVPLILAPYVTTGRDLTYRCEATELPGRTFQTAQKKMGSAPVEKFPYHTDYNEVTMTFIVTDSMKEKVFFDYWMDLINPTTDYNFQYKANYAVDISINQYDVSNQLTYAAVLREAFPIGMNQMDVDWSNGEAYHKLSVIFTYKQWNNNTLQGIGNGIGQQLITGAVNDLQNLF